MKLAKILFVVVMTVVLVSCGNSTGELIGVSKPGSFKEATPYGMVFIKRGSFMMGENTQSAIFGQPDNPLMTTVSAFWMDETEVTNNEYKQFVFWVRDSIAYHRLVDAGLVEYAIQPRDGDFDEENYDDSND